MLKKIIIGLIILIIVVIYIFNKSSLTSFSIKAFEQDLRDIYTLNTLFFEESKGAIFYEVKIYDETNQLLKVYKTKDNYLTIEDLPVKPATNIYFKVIAYDEHGKHKSSRNKLKHVWLMPTIGTDSKYISSNTNLIINVNGLEDVDGYSLIGVKGEEKFYSSKVDTSSVIIPSSLIENYKGYLRFYLLLNSNNTVVSSLEVGVGLNEVTDMKMVYPNSAKLKWKDFYLSFNGGDNAYYYTLSVKNWLGQYIIYEKEFNTKEVLIEANKFKTSTNYKVIIKAYNKLDYKYVKEVTTTFNFMKMKKAFPIIASVKGGKVRIGERLRLVSPDNISIYYTTDGTDPTIGSLKYEGPIVIKKDMIIKTKAIDNNYYDSDIKTYNYQAIERLPIVYLSPSTQTQNKGVARAGYTNEHQMMNKIADVVERKLKEADVIVYRNTKDLKLSEVSKISKGLNVDLHLAIHSNAMTAGTSKESKVRGVLTFVYDETSPVLELANVIEDGLIDVYPGPKSSCDIVYGKNFSRNITEIKPTNFPNSILLEIGFHDNYDDAYWIVHNINKIGESIANSIIKYFNNNME